ncbi:MAG: hypothetical protein NWS56_03610 [Haliea sp.]|nr:hypothetical protein [Haliea sp.]
MHLADQTVPYSPAIPVLVPGQKISREIAGFLFDVCRANNGSKIYGLVKSDGELCLRVVQCQ